MKAICWVTSVWTYALRGLCLSMVYANYARIPAGIVRAPLPTVPAASVGSNQVQMEQVKLPVSGSLIAKLAIMRMTPSPAEGYVPITFTTIGSV